MKAPIIGCTLIENYLGWTRGGYARYGEVTYSVEPLVKRLPYSNPNSPGNPTLKCNLTNTTNVNEPSVQIWGTRWNPYYLKEGMQQTFPSRVSDNMNLTYLVDSPYLTDSPGSTNETSSEWEFYFEANIAGVANDEDNSRISAIIRNDMANTTASLGDSCTLHGDFDA
jgi:hypothetical protein